MDQAISTFSDWQLNVVLSPNIFGHDHSYLAAKDEGRLSDFQNMIDDPEISAIVCARGGYGTTRILDQFGLSTPAEKSKVDRRLQRHHRRSPQAKRVRY